MAEIYQVLWSLAVHAAEHHDDQEIDVYLFEVGMRIQTEEDRI